MYNKSRSFENGPDSGARVASLTPKYLFMEDRALASEYRLLSAGIWRRKFEKMGHCFAMEKLQMGFRSDSQAALQVLEKLLAKLT